MRRGPPRPDRDNGPQRRRCRDGGRGRPPPAEQVAAQDQQAAEAAAYQQQQASAQAAAAAPPPPAVDKMAELRKLGELKTQGILTEEEFAAEKAKILPS
jgi:membrane protease subunit (stomatin/prohibitin family)